MNVYCSLAINSCKKNIHQSDSWWKHFNHEVHFQGCHCHQEKAISSWHSASASGHLFSRCSSLRLGAGGFIICWFTECRGENAVQAHLCSHPRSILHWPFHQGQGTPELQFPHLQYKNNHPCFWETLTNRKQGKHPVKKRSARREIRVTIVGGQILSSVQILKGVESEALGTSESQSRGYMSFQGMQVPQPRRSWQVACLLGMSLCLPWAVWLSIQLWGWLPITQMTG